jgi:hypothetical protein
MFNIVPSEPKLRPDQMARFIEHINGILRRITQGRAKSATVFHYTNGTGLIGIIEKKRLWATHVGYMNDWAEYFEAIKTLREAIDRKLKKTTLSKSQDLIVAATIRSLEKTKIDSIYPWFVTCFSECRDDLAQWRGYSGGQSKIAIGFDLNHLSLIARTMKTRMSDDGRQKYQSFLVPVIYDTSEKAGLADEVATFILEQYPIDEAEAKPDDNEAFAEDWLTRFFSLISVLAPALKNESFSGEREWRLISMPNLPSVVNYRTRASILTPYLEIEYNICSVETHGTTWTQPIRKVDIGPASHGDLTHYAAKCLLEKHSFGGVDIEVSKIPFRDI